MFLFSVTTEKVCECLNIPNTPFITVFVKVWYSMKEGLRNIVSMKHAIDRNEDEYKLVLKKKNQYAVKWRHLGKKSTINSFR